MILIIFFLNYKMNNKIIVSKIGRVTIPTYDDYLRINTTYKASGIWKQLSPMRLGPFEIVEPLVENTLSYIDGQYIEQPILSYYPDGVLPGFEYREDREENGNVVGYQYAICLS